MSLVKKDDIELPPEALSATVRMGYALALKGAASADWRGPLQARILEYQARLLQVARDRRHASDA